MNIFSHDPREEIIKKNLFRNAMRSNWQEVIKIYKQKVDQAHKAKITRSGDTALHIAISDGQESVVEELVLILEKSTLGKRSALEMKNELGNTPLHLAAYLGNVRMCRCIAKGESELMGIRNNDNETPFFLTVLHGRKDAFLCLHDLCEGDQSYGYCRGRDGDTILHSAISGEYFDLAFQIIHRYDKLLNCVNEQGFLALHILASKPSAFSSGSHIRGFDKLIYHCIFVDELTINTIHNQAEDLQYDQKNAKYPENYQTCMGIFVLLRNILRVLMGHSRHQQDEKYAKGQQHVHEKVLSSTKKKNDQKADEEGQQSGDDKQGMRSSTLKAQGVHEFFPDNYVTCFHFLEFIAKAMLVILGLGSRQVVKIRQKKEKHKWSVQIMEELLEHASSYEYEHNGKRPRVSALGKDNTETAPYAVDDDQSSNEFDQILADDHNIVPMKEDTNDGRIVEMEKKETAILMAAKNGIKEMVEAILDRFPVAIHDINNEKKNIVLLAVEHRQPHVYNFLLNRKTMKETIFRKTDKDGNSASHLAAMMGEYRPWLIPGAALQMQWEIKWYQFVKKSMPLHFFPRYNNKLETPKGIFSESHRQLAKEGGEWLTHTSESCSVVAALIATVAFATSATVPGGVKSENGVPTLQNEPAFAIFAISSLVALCFSVTSVVMFLSILTSRYQEKDFRKDLPRKLLVGLTSLFVSIGSMLLSFCAGHFFVLKEKLKYTAFPMYAITCLPVTFFAIAQFPLYFDLVKATIRKLPQRSSR